MQTHLIILNLKIHVERQRETQRDSFKWRAYGEKTNDLGHHLMDSEKEGDVRERAKNSFNYYENKLDDFIRARYTSQ